MSQRIAVRTERSYDVVVGRGLAPDVVDLASSTSASKVAIIHPIVLTEAAQALRPQLSGGREVHLVAIPDGESAKSADVLQFCWDVLAEARFTRSDLIIALGGGSTTDLAGFVAASWLRGVNFITVPTTVLGMVDAAVGGKTGINIAHGKNLVGAFHEPIGVICDLNFLRTLPAGEIRSGMAEVLKCGFISNSTILDDFERNATLAMDPGTDLMADLVMRGIAVKAAVVAADLMETGQARHGAGSASAESARTQADAAPAVPAIGREALNYGHTLGHAIESLENYSGLRHGEAISIGMVFAAELAYRRGGIDTDLLQRHRRVLGTAGLPTSYRADAFDELLPIMALDKKARGDMLRFVVLQRQRPTTLVRSDAHRPGQTEPVIAEGPDPDVLRECFASLNVQ